MDLLVLDDYGLARLNQEQRHDFLEILEDRHGLKSTLVTSQLNYWVVIPSVIRSISSENDSSAVGYEYSWS